jgi:tRNA threonylcarbamoyl adenosine modification protein YeaZ
MGTPTCYTYTCSFPHYLVFQCSVNWIAIETSSSQVSLASGKDSECTQQVIRQGNASQIIESSYQELNPDLDSVDQVFISKGPGSYNGLRVGYAFLKGLLVCDSKSVIEVPTPLSLAAQAREKLFNTPSSILVLNNARRGEVYAAWIDCKGESMMLRSEQICAATELNAYFSSTPSVIVSYDYPPHSLLIYPEAPWLCLYPEAKNLSKVALSMKIVPTANLSELEPHYVRPPVPGSVGKPASGTICERGCS